MPTTKAWPVFLVILSLVLLPLPGSSPALYAQEPVGLEEILEMSLEELMNVEIGIGTLMSMERLRVPVSITRPSGNAVRCT